MHKPTIYINPKFRNAHINPNFLSKPNVTAHHHLQHVDLDLPNVPAGPIMPTNIHVNPNFIRPTHSIPAAASNVEPPIPAALCHPVASLGTVTQLPSNWAPIISQTTRHLVRQSLAVSPTSADPRPANTPGSYMALAAESSCLATSNQARIISKTSRHLVRQPLHLRPAAAMTKSPAAKFASNSPLLRIGTRKLVRRANNNPSVTIVRPSNSVSKPIVRKSNGLHSPNKYRLARKAVSSPKAIAALGLRQTPPSRPNATSSLKMVNLNIGGVIYKSTANKLQRHEATENNPRTASASVAAPTFNFVLRNSDSYRIRNRLTAARQKSIQTLLGPARNKSKNNVPCPIFQHLGKCGALERGRCGRTHDIRNVAICSKFLQGSCQASPCLLSHTVNLSKMPVCKFFLAGICGKTDCPYLHKKLNAKAEICTDFLRGFCKLADQCDKRHEFLCPDYAVNGKCGTGSRCPYPHRAVGDERGAPTKQPNQSDRLQKSSGKRVLLKERKSRSSDAAGNDAANYSIATADDTLVLIPSRLQLGALPSFIQL